MIKIWDNHNKQWLEPMTIHFGKDNSIWRITANIPRENPMNDGWYEFEGETLKEISIIGGIDYNTELLNQQI